MNTDFTDKQRFSSAFHRCRSAPHRWLILFLFLLSSSAVAQQNRWTLTTADFQTRQVDLVSIDDNGVSVLIKAGEAPQQIRWDSLLALDRALEPKPSNAKFILALTTGDQLRGEPTKIDGDTLTFNAVNLGSMTIPLKQVVAIARQVQNIPAGRDMPAEDLAVLSNGDSVRGIISALADKQITVQVNGTPTPVPLDSIATILFASTNSASQNQSRAFRIKLADDSLVTAQSIATNEKQLVLKLTTGDATVPLDSVASIEQLNGPVSWLSSRAPSQSIQTPLLATTRPAKMDRTVSNTPIRFGDRTYARGIGVAPYSKITWPLDPTQGYKAFRTRYAIDGNSPYADVSIRILLDGKPVHERKSFTSGQLSPVVVVPLGNAKTLTLEIDFGGNYNVQDHLNWIEPALLKTMPATPTTR